MEILKGKIWLHTEIANKTKAFEITLLIKFLQSHICVREACSVSKTLLAYGNACKYASKTVFCKS